MKKMLSIVVLASAVAAAPVSAQQGQQQGQMISLEEAIAVTLTENPALKAAAYEERAAQQERRAAIGLRMPQINRVHDAIERYNPFATQETETESESTNESTSSDSGTSDSTARARALNTTAPQVSMIGKDDMAYYDSGTGTENASTASTRSDSTGTATSTSTGRSSSRSGYLSDQIAAWMDGYNNTDLMVFDALEVCFSQVLSVPDPLW